MKLLVCDKMEIDYAVLDKFDHLSLYYIYHFLSKKLKSQNYDEQMKFKSKEILRNKIIQMTRDYVGYS